MPMTAPTIVPTMGEVPAGDVVFAPLFVPPSAPEGEAEAAERVALKDGEEPSVEEAVATDDTETAALAAALRDAEEPRDADADAGAADTVPVGEELQLALPARVGVAALRVAEALGDSAVAAAVALPACDVDDDGDAVALLLPACDVDAVGDAAVGKLPLDTDGTGETVAADAETLGVTDAGKGEGGAETLDVGVGPGSAPVGVTAKSTQS